MPFQPNPGHIPPECELRDLDGHVTGYRAVHVRLFGGYDSKRRGDAPWIAGGGRLPVVWRIGDPPHPFQIEEFEIA